MRSISQIAVNRLTKPWEEFVAYPYDDKVPKRRDPATGKRAYPEWKGGPIVGTITQGYGHTNAAGGPKIEVGSSWTEAYAAQVLADDMRPCCRAVERRVKVPLTQHQFDTLADFVFNAGEGTLAKSTLLRKLNTGDYDSVPSELMKFVFSKGERMRGLENRRRAEIAMWQMPDEAAEHVKATAPIAPEQNGVEEDELACPKADLPPARSALDSKSIAGGATTAATGATLVAKGIEQANEAAEPVKQVQENLQSFGLWDQLVGFVTAHPMLVAGAVVVVLGAFMAWDRWRHLHNEAR